MNIIKSLIIYLFITSIPNLLQSQINFSSNKTNWDLTLWTKTAGPYGGKVNCMEEGSGRIFIGSASGIYISTDFGLSWLFSNYGFDNSKIFYDIKDINVNGNRVFTVTSDDVYYSSNNGDSWNKITPTSFWWGNPNSVTTRTIGSDTYIFAGTSEGVYRSSDYGVNWTQHNNGLWDQYVRKIFHHNGVIYVATPIGGVFRSTDDGDNWMSANTGLTDSSITTFYAFDQLIFASTSTGVFRSTNNGATWGLLSNSPKYVNAFYYDGNYLLATGSYRIYFSTNYGASWPITKDLKISSDYISTNIKGITKHLSNLIAITDSRAGIYKSTNNGDNWFASNYYLNANAINCFGLVSSTLYCGTNSGLFKTTDNGVVWFPVIPDSNGPIVKAFINTKAGIFLGTHQGIYNSTDDGTTWNKTSFTLWTNTLLLYGPYIFAGTYDGIFRSSDYGISWDSVNTGLKNRIITTLLGNPPYILAGTDGGGIYRSSNNGVTWDSSITQPTNRYILSLAKLNNILIAGGRYNNWNWKVIYRSVDDGLSWTPIQLADIISHPPSVHGFAVSDSTIFAATGRGIYVSKDYGFHWYQANDGLWEKVLSAIIATNTQLFVGTNSNGVWRCSLQQILDVAEPENEYPQYIVLYQNYPNPFNPSTKIRYSLDKNCFVTLKIYNILGEEIATLVNEIKHKGSYETNFNTNNLPSGVYLYKMTAKPLDNTSIYNSVRKMLLLK